jgi:hypothetical protein
MRRLRQSGRACPGPSHLPQGRSRAFRPGAPAAGRGQPRLTSVLDDDGIARQAAHVTAMEPAVERREHGSQNLGR